MCCQAAPGAFSKQVPCPCPCPCPALGVRVQVVIDNMMNLQLMWEASEMAGGQPEWRDMAVQHANRTAQDFFRCGTAQHARQLWRSFPGAGMSCWLAGSLAVMSCRWQQPAGKATPLGIPAALLCLPWCCRGDGSTWHKIIYDADSGSVAEKGTHQGFSANSTWTRWVLLLCCVLCLLSATGCPKPPGATHSPPLLLPAARCLTLAPAPLCPAPRRGQAWALHGFTAAYEATGEPLFLSTAQAAADLFLGRLSQDWVPVWDFDAPSEQAWKDSSAGAVAAGGLLRLAEVAEGAVRGVRYRSAALRMLHALATAYLADTAPQLALASVLRNATLGALGPGGGTMFGDYYFLEALAYQQRQQQQGQAEQQQEGSAAAD